MKRTGCVVAAAVVLVFCTISPCWADHWPSFRGPTGLGYTSETALPVHWGGASRQNVIWEAPLLGQGHASPIVWGDKVFVCTASWPAGEREREKTIPLHHVTCYQTSDGKRLWDTRVPPGPWVRNDFRSGPGGGYAAPTPATDGKRVYCAFGSSVLAAIDFRGNLVWRKEIVPPGFDVTLGTSPILYRDTVIMFCAMGQPRNSHIVAYAADDGSVRWQRKLPETGFGHSTPVVIKVKGKAQLLLLASGMQTTPNALQSLDPTSGEPIWWCRGAGDASSPAYAHGLVYFDSGRGGLGVAVGSDGQGDVSGSQVKWTINENAEALSSPIIVGDYLYRLQGSSILKCFDIVTGKRIYAERLPGISSTWASPVADPHGRLFLANAGKSYVIEAGPRFHILAVNDLGDGNHPSPAVADNKIFLVGLKSLYCVGTRK